jgi:thiamine biosynthesis lipoprotein
MGTTFRVVVHHTDQRVAHQAIATALEQAVVLDGLLSEWKPDSPIGQLNQAAGGSPVTFPPRGFDALHQSVQLAQLTDGAFDPTWAALWEVWTFEPGAVPPPDDTIAARLKWVGHQHLVLDPKTATARLPEAGMAVGLGAMGKGYALRDMAAVLGKAGLDHYAIEAGGQWVVLAPEAAEPWSIEIRHPRSEGPLSKVHLRAGSIATSGDYERFFEHEGVRYHHLLDPRTGRPARAMQAVSVIHPDPLRADVFSTACFVAGPAACGQWAKAETGMRAMWIDGEASSGQTPGW